MAPEQRSQADIDAVILIRRESMALSRRIASYWAVERKRIEEGREEVEEEGGALHATGNKPKNQSTKRQYSSEAGLSSPVKIAKVST